MKRARILLSVMTLVVSALSSDAYAKVALAQVRIKVIDQDGAVVPNAKVRGGFTCGGGMNDYVQVDGLTNTNGMYVAEGRCNELLRFDVRKEGYYRTSIKIEFWRSKADPKVVDGKWQPYGETRTVVLKKIRNLGLLMVPDVGKPFVRERKIPRFDCWIPFDLEKFDWNAPYGMGTHPDVLLRFRNRTTPRWYDFTDCMDISFTNNPFAGAYEVKKDGDSDMKTVYVADPNATYKSDYSFVCERTANGKRTEIYLKDDSYLVFRTRTAVDDEGRLKTAHYGIIHGYWMSGGDNMRFTDGCFNTTENDRNIEDGYYLREKVNHYKDIIRLLGNNK